MPSSYTNSLRLEKQQTGDNINVWGEKLNAALDRIDYAAAGFISLPITANHTLTTSNSAPDQARVSMIELTGPGAFIVTLPGVSKQYIFKSSCTYGVIISTGSGDAISIDPGDIVHVICDGTNVNELGYGGLGLKEYIASVAFAASGSLPALAGNSGKFTYTDGTAAFWKAINLSDLSDYPAAKQQATALAAAFAINLR